MFATIAKLLAKRILVAIPTLLLVSVLLFIILRLLPVDPAAMSLPPTATIQEVEAKRVEMGLDRPLPVQYAIWLGQTLRGDFGQSIQYRTDVARLIGDTLPATMELAFMAMAVASVIGIAGGLLIFHLRGGPAETVLEVGSIGLLSMPEFLWSLILMLLVGVTWGLLPFSGRVGPGISPPDVTGFLLLDALITGQFAVLKDALLHMVLPVLALGIAASPSIMRVLRSSLLDVYQDDYIHQARLRGQSERRILLRHGLKNAILPTLSLMGVQFGFLFGGTLLVEIIYSFPGMGNLMVDAIRNADLPIIQAVGLTYCVMVLVISVAVDSLYLILNPKLRVR
ncbi:ABC transporter permease [Falsirhodobacter sp. 1013]|uniref:ABC transporter permease n=1 Tax=Falsirhodobacter sp. 1013 TaxID=3417566 RepID=UPI003EBEA562